MQKDEHEKPIIIVKRIVKKKAGHHGGAWKIAYADFVTAMMSFFLLMWLLSMLNKYQLLGISNYFNKKSQNVYVDNQKNDIKTPKTPNEHTKKYSVMLPDDQKSTTKQKLAIAQNPAASKSKDKTPNPVIKQPEKSPPPKPEDLAHKKDYEDLQKFMKKMQNDLQTQSKEYQGRLSFQMVNDGLKIDLKDLQNKPMFSSGKADFKAYAQKTLTWLSKQLSDTNHRIVIIGYTDSEPFPDKAVYTNWELSADRANAARRALIEYGMPAGKVVQIQAFASEKPKVPDYIDDGINRRIEIIVLTNKALKKLLKG